MFPCVRSKGFLLRTPTRSLCVGNRLRKFETLKLDSLDPEILSGIRVASVYYLNVKEPDSQVEGWVNGRLGIKSNFPYTRMEKFFLTLIRDKLIIT